MLSKCDLQKNYCFLFLVCRYIAYSHCYCFAFSLLTLLVGHQEEHPVGKN